MTWVDIVFIVLVLGYAGLGFFTGALQRLIGLVALYPAFVAATNMGIQAGGILQQSSGMDTADSRVYGFFGIVAAVMIVIEVATQLAKSQIKIEAIVFNRVTGVVVGVLTGFLLGIVTTFELTQAGNPFGGSELNAFQQNIHDAIGGSHVARPITELVGKPIIAVFQPVLPSDPTIFFGPGPVR